MDGVTEAIKENREEASRSRAEEAVTILQGMCPWRRHWAISQWDYCVNLRIGYYINKQVFPQAPSPTMTSLRRISAMAAADKLNQRGGESERVENS